MIAELMPDIDRDIVRRFGTVADGTRVRRAARALEANGINVLRAANAAEAKRIVLGLIPDGSQVHHGASMSLDVAGITEEIELLRRYLVESRREHKARNGRDVDVSLHIDRFGIH